MIRSAIRAALRKAGFDLVRHVEMPVNPFSVLPLVVADCVNRHGDVTFLQIGANDGVRNDPIRPLVLKYRLRGIFVEPIPDMFAKLTQNYAGCEGLAFERAAIGERDGQATMYRIRSDPSLPDWLQGIASFNRRHLSSAKFGIEQLERNVEAITVPVLTIPTLLKKHAVKQIGLLQVDTEGFDCHLVRLALQSGLRPWIIHYEFNHAPPQDRAQCKRLLARLGYRFIDVGRDTLALLEDQPNQE